MNVTNLLRRISSSGSYDLNSGGKDIKAIEDIIWKAFSDGKSDQFKSHVSDINWRKISSYQFFPWREIENASKNEGKENFVQILIDSGFNINENFNRDGNATIHYAAVHGNFPLLQMLTANHADVNIQNEQQETAIHCILKTCGQLCQQGTLCDSHFNCFCHLIDLPDIDLNIVDSDQLSPLEYALRHQNLREYINLLLDKKDKLISDSLKDEDGNIRESLLEIYPDLRTQLEKTPSKPKINTVSKAQLLASLRKGEDSEFCQHLLLAMKETPKLKLTRATDGRYTFLQQACKKGMINSVNLLLKSGADINLSQKKSERPIFLACKFGHLPVVQTLLSQPDVDITPDEFAENLLHVVVQSEKLDCLSFLLKEAEIDVNNADDSGRTPLHYAVIYENEDCVCQLLDNKAHIDVEDFFGQKPLSNLSYKILKKHLDGKIGTNGEHPKSQRYALTLDYRNLLRQQKEEQFRTFPTNLMLEITKLPELSEAIAHPMFSTLIFFKWRRIRLFYYFNLIFYTAFCILYTIYILLGEKQLMLKSAFLKHGHSLQIVLLLIIAILAILEAIEVTGVTWRYLSSLGNWVRSSVVILSCVDIANGCSAYPLPRYCPQVCAVSILVTWIELFLVVGMHPKLTFYVDMFNAASLVLLKFLVIHIFLLIAFALCFHTLFRTNDETNPFSNPLQALFKTIIMLTSEFDASDIPFDSYALTSHLLFVVFIFLVTIVLVNLLIGLASSATKQVEDNAFLYKCKAQVKIISHFENTYFFNNKFIRRVISNLPFFRRKNSHSTNNTEIHIFPNKNNKMKNSFNFYAHYHHGIVIQIKDSANFLERLDDEIVRDAQQILANKKIKTEERQDEKVHLQDRLASLEEEVRGMKTILSEFLNKIENVSHL